MTGRPKVNSASQNELQKAAAQVDAFDASVKEMTLDRMNAAPKQEAEPQTKISQRDLAKTTDIYLKPDKTISCQDKFNEGFRKNWEYDKEYVNFVAENKEIIGETIEMWTKPYAGIPAEFWKIPTNKPIWAPRYVAEQIKRCTYHRLVMQENRIVGSDGMGQYYGSMAADTTIQRLDAHPVNSRKSVFMGAGSF